METIAAAKGLRQTSGKTGWTLVTRGGRVILLVPPGSITSCGEKDTMLVGEPTELAPTLATLQADLRGEKMTVDAMTMPTRVSTKKVNP